MYEDNVAKGSSILPISRRRFVQGLAAGGAVAALGWGGRQAFGETGQQQAPATLTGKSFELTIDSIPVNFTGRHSVATAVNGSVPGPILRWGEGDTVTVAVTNHQNGLAQRLAHPHADRKTNASLRPFFTSLV
jgi:FtsP/CotA-like multicopper oxidase with cupredoxin domain